MSWIAFDKIEDAVNRTKSLLLPFDKGVWLRLAILAIFTGSGLSSPNFPTGNFGGSDYGGGSYDESFSTADLQENPELSNILSDPVLNAPTAAFSAAENAAIIGAGVTLITVVLLLLLISSVFQFVYYQSLIHDDVSIRDNFREHLRDGIRYMILTIGFLILMAGALGAGALGFLANPIIGVLGLISAIAFLVPLAILMGLVNNFIIPETIRTEQTFWSSIKTGFVKVRNAWKQVGIYILTRFGLKMLVGILTMLYALITILVLAIPFGILGVLLYLATPILAVIPVVIGLLVWFVLLIGAQVVVQTFLNYYAICVWEEI